MRSAQNVLRLGHLREEARPACPRCKVASRVRGGAPGMPSPPGGGQGSAPPDVAPAAETPGLEATPARGSLTGPHDGRIRGQPSQEGPAGWSTATLRLSPNSRTGLNGVFLLPRQPADGARRVEHLDLVDHPVVTVWVAGVIHVHPENLPCLGQRHPVGSFLDPAGAIDRSMGRRVRQHREHSLGGHGDGQGGAHALLGHGVHAPCHGIFGPPRARKGTFSTYRRRGEAAFIEPVAGTRTRATAIGRVLCGGEWRATTTPRWPTTRPAATSCGPAATTVPCTRETRHCRWRSAPPPGRCSSPVEAARRGQSPTMRRSPTTADLCLPGTKPRRAGGRG